MGLARGPAQFEAAPGVQAYHSGARHLGSSLVVLEDKLGEGDDADARVGRDERRRAGRVGVAASGVGGAGVVVQAVGSRVVELDEVLAPVFPVPAIGADPEAEEVVARGARERVEVSRLRSQRGLPLSPSNSRVFERSHPVRKKAFTLRETSGGEMITEGIPTEYELVKPRSMGHL